MHGPPGSIRWAETRLRRFSAAPTNSRRSGDTAPSYDSSVRRRTPRVHGGARFAGSLVFFIISNFGVWALGSPGINDIPYDRNLNGLIECYILAIPFFGNTFISTLIFSYLAIFIYRSLAARSSAR